MGAALGIGAADGMGATLEIDLPVPRPVPRPLTLLPRPLPRPPKELLLSPGLTLRAAGLTLPPRYPRRNPRGLTPRAALHPLLRCAENPELEDL